MPYDRSGRVGRAAPIRSDQILEVADRVHPKTDVVEMDVRPAIAQAPADVGHEQSEPLVDQEGEDRQEPRPRLSLGAAVDPDEGAAGRVLREVLPERDR